MSAALNLWGLVELEKLAYAASAPFVVAGVKESSREEVFKILRGASDPYEEFREKIAKAANAGRVKLAEPWESLRLLIMPKLSEEKRLMMGKTYRELDEGKKKALFYATLALEEAFGVYRSVLRKYAEERGKAVQRVKVGEEPFKNVVYVADLGQIKQLVEEEEAAFEDALSTLRKRLNEYAVRYGLGDLLNVEEGKARELAEAKQAELSELNDVNFSTKVLAALMAYREYALGRRGAFGKAAWHWLEVGGSARLLYHTPKTAYNKAVRAEAERPAAVEEMVAEGRRRLFLKPSADHYSRFVEELTKSGKLALMLEKETKSSHVFRLFKLEEGGGLKELGVKLRISRVGGEYNLCLGLRCGEVARVLQAALEAGMKAAEEVKGRLPVEDLFSYMAGWVNSDVTITRMGRKRVLQITTSHLWQLAETHALFDWSYVTVPGVSLTLEGPKPQFHARASLEKLDEAIREARRAGGLRCWALRRGAGRG